MLVRLDHPLTVVRSALLVIRRPMSQGEILNCDLTSHTSADLDPYSATDFHESAVTDFYERQDDCGRGQLDPNVGGGIGGGSGKPNYAPSHGAQQGIYVGGVIRKKYHGGWEICNSLSIRYSIFHLS